MADDNKTTKKPGLLGGKKRREFQMAPTPSQPYTGTSTTEAAATKKPETAKEIDYNEMLKSKRQSIVVPALNKLEFDALLNVSEDFFYSYELLADIVYKQVQSLPEDLKVKYDRSLEELKSKEIKKLKRNDKKAAAKQ